VPAAKDKAFAVASCAALAAYNNVIHLHPWHYRRYVPLNLCATGVAVSAALASGLRPADLGLARWSPGRAASGLAAAVAAGWVVIAVVPATRPLLSDKRIESLQGRAIAYQSAVRIPLGTVLWEETAFRGVLHAALRRVMPESAAIAVGGGVFGLWHIRSTYQALRVNDLAGDRSQVLARLSAAVVVSAAAGALLSSLRARSGSLTAPMLLHLVTNCGGPIAAWAVGRRARSRSRSSFPAKSSNA
jgi:uncharacterized protein